MIAINLLWKYWESLSPTITCMYMCTYSHTQKKVHTHKYTRINTQMHSKQPHVCICAQLFQSCLTPCDPMDYIPPGSFVHRILQSRILEWVVISFSHICVRIWYLSLSFWLTSLCIIGSRFAYFIRTDSNVFLFMKSDIPLCICNTTSLSIHLSMDI